MSTLKPFKAVFVYMHVINCLPCILTVFTNALVGSFLGYRVRGNKSGLMVGLLICGKRVRSSTDEAAETIRCELRKAFVPLGSAALLVL